MKTDDLKRVEEIVSTTAEAPPSSVASAIAGFDLEALRLKQGFADTFGVKRKLTNVPVGKAKPDQFFRVNADEDWQLQTMVLELKTEREYYILTPSVCHVVPELSKPMALYTAVDRAANPFLIPVPLPASDGKWHTSHQSLAQVVLKAQTHWVRCSWNPYLSAYDLYVAEALEVDPKWPDMGFRELVSIAFRGRIIDDAKHPVIKQVLGLS